MCSVKRFDKKKSPCLFRRGLHIQFSRNCDSCLFLLFREVNSTKHQSSDGCKADPDRKVRGVAGVGGLGFDRSGGRDRTVSGSGGRSGRAGSRGVGLELEEGVCAFDLSRLVERLAKEQVVRRSRGQVGLVQRDRERDFIVLILEVGVLGAGVVDLLGQLLVGVDLDVVGDRLQNILIGGLGIVDFRSGFAKVDGDLDVRSTISVSGDADGRSRSFLGRFRRAGRRAGTARTGAGLVIFSFCSNAVNDSEAEERECHGNGKNDSDDFTGLGSGHNECLLRVFAGSRRNGILHLTVYIFSVPNTIKK